MHPSFVVPIHDIDAGGVARSLELAIPWLEHAFADTDITAAAPAHADVRLSRTGHDVVVRGKVTATIVVPCARCISPVTFPIEAELSLLLRPARPEPPAAKHPAAKDKDPAAKPNGNPKKARPRDDDEYEFSADEADSDSYEGELVVLDGFLREAILLEAPSFPLCSEDCPGIRPKPSPERGEPSIDPRLSPLRALKTKLKLAGPPGAEPAAPAAGDGPQPSSSQAAEAAPERPLQAGKAARPRIHAHRTRGSIAASGASKKARTKQSPKRAK